MFLPEIELATILVTHCSLKNLMQKKQNALHAAAQKWIHKSIIDLLVEKGVDVTCEDEVSFSF